MTAITAIAKKFFEACEAGKGWDGCKEYCKADATFSAQAEPLADIRKLQQYTDWMKGLLTFMPDGRYDLKSFATDEERQSVCAYGVFLGTHTGAGGPCPPTGKGVRTDYVYVMEFDGNKIRHMTKIWHAGLAMKELGWVQSIVGSTWTVSGSHRVSEGLTSGFILFRREGWRINHNIRTHADETEQERRLSPSVVTALADAGIFRMYTPCALGGSEVDPLIFSRVIDAACEWGAKNP